MSVMQWARQISEKLFESVDKVVECEKANEVSITDSVLPKVGLFA